MVGVQQTLVFKRWFADLRDDKARARIQARIDRLSLGQRGRTLAVLLAGGDKRSQQRDIEKALDLLQGL